MKVHFRVLKICLKSRWHFASLLGFGFLIFEVQSNFWPHTKFTQTHLSHKHISYNIFHILNVFAWCFPLHAIFTQKIEQTQFEKNEKKSKINFGFNKIVSKKCSFLPVKVKLCVIICRQKAFWPSSIKYLTFLLQNVVVGKHLQLDFVNSKVFEATSTLKSLKQIRND